MRPAVLVLGVLVGVGWVYWLVAWVAVRRLLRRPPPPRSPLPAVSVLKPLRGLDPGAVQCFGSFFRQDYPEFEIVFGVEDPDDEAVPVIEKLGREFPDARFRLIVAPEGGPRGPNRKASLLEVLAREARHDILVAADSDMRVEPDYLRRVVGALLEPGVGLVTCPYRGEEALTVAAQLEALHMGVTFLPSAVLAGDLMGLPVAMGATVALRRVELEAVGGFAAVAHHLADDYELGKRVAALGKRVKVSPCVLGSVLGATTLRDQWDREVRWSRCARVSRPAGQLGYGVTFTVPLAAVFFWATGFGAAGAAVLAVSLAVRWTAASAIARLTGDAASLGALPLLPLRDFLGAAVWVRALVGRRVVWRGEAFDVGADGLLRPRSGAGLLPVATRR